MLRFLLALAVCPAILFIAPATALARDNVIATVSAPTPIDAYAGHVVWSELSSEGYRLVEYRDGQVRALPIAPQPRPFDVDLGPDREGMTVAVYSRCTATPPDYLVPDGQLGCDLYTYELATGRERPVRRVNSTADEGFPAIWKNRIAFTRTYRPKGRDSSGRRLAYWRRIRGEGRTRRLDKGPGYLRVPQHLDMRGARVALFWAGEFGGGVVRLVTTRGRTRTLATAPGSGAAALIYKVFGVTLVPGFVHWSVTQSSDTPEVGEVRRYDLSRHLEQRATVPVSPRTAGFAQDGSIAYLVIPRSEQGCEFRDVCTGPYDVHRVDELAFERAPKLQLR